MPMTPPPPDSIAESMTRAHGALVEVLNVIDARRDDLGFLPAGAALVARANRVRGRLQPPRTAAKDSAA